MERESFEDEEVAQILNKDYVSVKVDREERPDVDGVYMTYIQATSGGGGWPMTVFLTPDLEPIVGGTYFPPEDKYGRPGFKTLLQKITEAWNKDKAALIQQGSRTLAAITKAVNSAGSKALSSHSDTAAKDAIEKAYSQLESTFDEANGGFSSAPKFPKPSEVSLMFAKHLMTKAAASEDGSKALQMAELTLQKMAAGGIYDHIGGGFARYSVDEKWHVPHFEKMLYDNPQIANIYLDAFRATGKREYALVARGVLDYLLRDMHHPEGGFFSAEDADSMDPGLNEKREGAFYVWTESEIDEILGSDTKECELFKAYYTVKPQGNTNLSSRSDPHGEFIGKNVLINVDASLAKDEAQQRQLAEARQKLHQRRAARPRPHLDDKVVTSWNGAAISSLANASAVLASDYPPCQPCFPLESRPAADYLQAATQAAEFVNRRLWNEADGRLLRFYKAGNSRVQGYDSDYSAMIAGLLDLYGVTGQTKWLAWAYQLQDRMDELFWDSQSGGYFSTTGRDESIKLRMKDSQDGAEPASTSVAIFNLLRLAALSQPHQAAQLEEKARQCAAAYGETLSRMPVALTQMCCSLFLLTAGHLRQIIIAHREEGGETAAVLLRAVHAALCPDKVVILLDLSNTADVDFWRQHNPEVLAMAQSVKGNGASAFVCQNFACQAPTDDPEKLKSLLQNRSIAPKQTEISVDSLKM